MKHLLHIMLEIRPMSKSELAQVLDLKYTPLLRTRDYITDDMLKQVRLSESKYQKIRILPRKLIKIVLEDQELTWEYVEQKLYPRSN